MANVSTEELLARNLLRARLAQFPNRSTTFRASPAHGGMTLLTDTVQLRLSLEDAKAVLVEAIKYLQIDPVDINPETLAWLNEQEN